MNAEAANVARRAAEIVRGRPALLPPLLDQLRAAETDECIPWPGYVARDGYGDAQVLEGSRYAHRVAHKVVWVALYGPIPPGFDLDHQCRVKACVNPRHLQIASRWLNNYRKRLYETSHFKPTCRRGHPRSPENLWVSRDRRGRMVRKCRPCHVLWRAQRAKAAVEVTP